MIYRVSIPCINYDNTGVDFVQLFFEKDSVITKEEVINWLQERHSEERRDEVTKLFYNGEWLDCIEKIKKANTWPDTTDIRLTSSQVSVFGHGTWPLSVERIDIYKL